MCHHHVYNDDITLPMIHDQLSLSCPPDLTWGAAAVFSSDCHLPSGYAGLPRHDPKIRLKRNENACQHFDTHLFGERIRCALVSLHSHKRGRHIDAKLHLTSHRLLLLLLESVGHLCMNEISSNEWACHNVCLVCTPKCITYSRERERASRRDQWWVWDLEVPSAGFIYDCIVFRVYISVYACLKHLHAVQLLL